VCVFTPNPAACEDGNFCNGVSTCDAVSDCTPGTPPNCDDGNDCTEDLCNEVGDACNHIVIPGCDGIPTVSEWGLVILMLALLTLAKVQFGRPVFSRSRG